MELEQENGRWSGQGAPPASPASGYPGEPVYTASSSPAGRDRPIQVVASRRLTAAQYAQAYRACMKKSLLALLWCLILLEILLGVLVYRGCRIYPKTWETYVFMAVMLAAFIGGLLAAGLQIRQRGVLVRRAYACYADSEPPEGVLELYADRAVHRTAVSTTAILFSEATCLEESGDLIILARPGAFIAWRAEDLTPFDAQLLTAHVQRCIRPGLHRRQAPFYPWLREPLPIPVLEGERPVWLRVQVSGEQNRRIFAGLWRPARQWIPLVVSPILLLAGSLSMYSYITPNLLADLGIYTGGGLLFWAALLALRYCAAYAFAGRRTGLGAKRTDEHYAFTPDGLAVKLQDTVRFIDKRYVRAYNGKKAVTLQTPYAWFLIPWDAVSDPAILKTILSL